MSVNPHYLNTRQSLLLFLFGFFVLSYSPVASAATSAKPNSKVLQASLRDGVFVKLMECGLDCLPEGKQPLPALVNAVKLHCQAQTEGMGDGDRILALRENLDKSIQVTFERGGHTYSLKLDTNPAWGKGWKNSPQTEPQTKMASANTALSAENAATAPATMLADITPSTKLDYSGQASQVLSHENDAIKLSLADQEKILAEHDVVILIDRSGSMNTRDCPGGLSRWEWCREQATTLSKESEDYWPDGITVVVFSNDFEVYPHAHVKEVSDVFENWSPEGSTNTGSALWDRLRQYLREKSKNPKSTKPLVVAVITDGEPTDGRTTAEAIISATGQMQQPGDISITFLQVGNGATGSALLDELADKLVDEGARYDIVEHESYAQLLKMGLRQALVSAIVAPHLKPQQPGENTAHSDSFFDRIRSGLEKKWLRHHPQNGL